MLSPKQFVNSFSAFSSHYPVFLPYELLRPSSLLQSLVQRARTPLLHGCSTIQNSSLANDQTPPPPPLSSPHPPHPLLEPDYARAEFIASSMLSYIVQVNHRGGRIWPDPKALRYGKQELHAQWVAAMGSDDMVFALQGNAGVMLPWGRDYWKKLTSISERCDGFLYRISSLVCKGKHA